MTSWWWLVLGFAGQAMFSMRFLIQQETPCPGCC